MKKILKILFLSLLLISIGWKIDAQFLTTMSSSTTDSDGGEYLADYYVATDGDDTNPGTINDPWATPRHAVAAMVAGDTTYIRAGRYYIIKKDSLVYRDGDVSGNGSNGNPICLFGYPGEKVVIDAGGIDTLGSGIQPAIFFENSSYWNFKNFRVIGPTEDDLSENYATGFYIMRSSNIVLDQIQIDSSGGVGLNIIYARGPIHVINCDATGNGVVDEGNGDGFIASYTRPQYTDAEVFFSGCRALGNADDGFDTWKNERDVTFDSCWSIGNGIGAGDGTGFKLGRTDSAGDNGMRMLRHCLAAYNDRQGFNQNYNQDPITLYNCVSYKNEYGYYWYEDGSSTDTMHNCVSYDNNSSDAFVSVYTTYNSWDTPPGVTVTDADFISVDSTGISGPRGSNGELPNINFLKLASGSDLIDAGVDVGIGYNGASPDLGWFESDY